MHLFSRHRRPPADQALTRLEVLAGIGMLALLCFVLRPAIGVDAANSEGLVCVNNVRRIMVAMAMYAAESEDHLPHPSWGTVSGGDAGPDNWCYANRIGSGQYIPSVSGRSGPEAYTNQLPWYQAGQLARYLTSQRGLVCPTDWRESLGIRRATYTPRPLKLTSYAMHGTVGGYTGPRAGRLPSGTTDRSAEYLPTDIILWEMDETIAFAYNDAANAPEAIGEIVSRRHGASTGDGLGVIGRVGGTAELMRGSRFKELQQVVPRPNELFGGPGYP